MPSVLRTPLLPLSPTQGGAVKAAAAAAAAAAAGGEGAFLPALGLIYPTTTQICGGVRE